MKICAEDGFTDHQGQQVNTCRHPLLTRSEMSILSSGAWLTEAIPEKLINAIHGALSYLYTTVPFPVKERNY